MISIYDIITANELASFWTVSKQQRKPFFGESKFPDKKKLGLKLDWIKGARKAPVALTLSAFDAKAIPLSRKGFDKLSAQMPFFKNSMNVDEEQRQELNTLLASGNQALIDVVIGKIFDDETTLLESASIAREIMRMQILTTGSLSISSNGQAYTYDYGVPNDHKVTPAHDWDSYEDADPIADIIAWQDKIEEDTGVRPTDLLLNSTTFNHIKKCASVKNAVYVFGDGKVTVNATKVKELILTETGCTVYVYSKTYNNDSDVATKFVPDGCVVLMPAEAVGSTWFGTTPEESDLLNSNVANVNIVDTGVAITTTKETDPVNVMTKASMICLPSCEAADQLIIATVL